MRCCCDIYDSRARDFFDFLIFDHIKREKFWRKSRVCTPEVLPDNILAGQDRLLPSILLITTLYIL